MTQAQYEQMIASQMNLKVIGGGAILPPNEVAFVWGAPEGERQRRLFLNKYVAVGGILTWWGFLYWLGRQSGKKAKK